MPLFEIPLPSALRARNGRGGIIRSTFFLSTGLGSFFGTFLNQHQSVQSCNSNAPDCCRYFVLFPLRLILVIVGLAVTVAMVSVAALVSDPWKSWLQEKAVTFVNSMFLCSWCAVIVEKGDIPPRERGQIYVANHSSVVDICFLLQRQKYSITGQKHGGIIGFFQNHILNPLGCLWFNRMERSDRELVSELIKKHSRDLSKPPLLVFPEGTCVNNEYVVMFKRGAFELGTSIVPVAIKYNKVFVDPYWNSRASSFAGHLFRLMTVRA